jgi:hypothetical protein
MEVMPGRFWGMVKKLRRADQRDKHDQRDANRQGYSFKNNILSLFCFSAGSHILKSTPFINCFQFYFFSALFFSASSAFLR